MSHLFRRTLATLSPAGPSTLTASSLPSINATAPLAVRKRRAEIPLYGTVLSPSPSSLLNGKTPKKLHPKMEAEYQALREQGQFKGDEASGRRAFLKGQLAWRSRVRGMSYSKMDFVGKYSSNGGEAVQESDDNLDDNEDTPGYTLENPEIIGQRIYLPNIQIRLMRNHTPPNQAYDPMIATFRIPQSMTKTDLRSYLSAVYNLPVTFIRTDNYIAPVKRIPGGMIARAGGSTKTYKRAVVGLVEPFHYPDDVEELYAIGQKMGMGDALGDGRKKWLEDRFMIERMQEYRKKALMKFYKGYRWRSRTHDNEGNVMREIMQKRAEREGLIREEAGKRASEATV